MIYSQPNWRSPIWLAFFMETDNRRDPLKVIRGVEAQNSIQNTT